MHVVLLSKREKSVLENGTKMEVKKAHTSVIMPRMIMSSVVVVLRKGRETKSKSALERDASRSFLRSFKTHIVIVIMPSLAVLRRMTVSMSGMIVVVVRVGVTSLRRNNASEKRALEEGML